MLSVTQVSGSYRVYNIHVQHPSHTYMVDGHVVHNIKQLLASGGMTHPEGQWVGERGAEWFQPKTPGYVLSAQNSMKALASRMSSPYPAPYAARTINTTVTNVNFYGTQNYNLNKGDSMDDFIRRQKYYARG